MTPDPTLSAWSRADHRVARDFMALARGYWRGPQRAVAWLLTGSLALFLLGIIAVNVGMNRWQKWFFDALEAKALPSVWQAILTLPLIVLAAAAMGVGVVWARETLQTRWREWLTRMLLSRWIGEDRFHRLGSVQGKPSNPEFRLTDDIRLATEPLVDFAIGLFNALLNASVFIGILWVVGGALRIETASGGFTIPGYMVWCALFYGLVVSALSHWVGKPLIAAVSRRNEAEASYRIELMRLRENSAQYVSENRQQTQHRVIAATYDIVVNRWLRVVRKHCHLTWITNSTGVFSPIFPMLMCAPKYLTGQMSLGDVMSVAAAFVHVNSAIVWLVDNYRNVAIWYASADRVMELIEVLDSDDQKPSDQAEPEQEALKMMPLRAGE